MDVTSPVREIRSIGPKSEQLFKKAGIETVRDLYAYYPRTYERFERPVPIASARFRDFSSVEGVLVSAPVTRYVRNLKITDAILKDDAGATLKLSWFSMPYLSKTLHAGARYVFRGKLTGSGAMRKMSQPRIYRVEEYRELEQTLRPVYSLPKGLNGEALRRAIRNAFDAGVFPEETLPKELLHDYGLIPLSDAVHQIHFPESVQTFERARDRLAFEEFYRFLLRIRELKEEAAREPNRYVIEQKRETDAFIRSLPYELTNAQKKVLEEIRNDMSGATAMNRLLQGDVGSGKTILCFIAMYEAALNGYESILMAPTEVLARQHYENFRKLSETYGLGLSISLLTGSMTTKEKKEVYERIATHRTDLIVGTHAVIQKHPVYEDLGLVITDEQHRFGVRQREALQEKSRDPHVIVLSATPIPRTLGMILYGDMDLSVLDEAPKNRLPIKTAVVDIEFRPNAYRFIEKEVKAGHQAYVICPLVEESELSDGENVVDYAKKLSDLYGDGIVVRHLHGKMKNEEKEAIMAAFARNEIQVLVSTTVIEVGIDVSNATVILIENAERFGLASLHQIRGRVGRGADQSYCILVDTTRSEESKERLDIIGHSTDGFHIASEDLRLRGPGDFFGVRQSGDMSFKIADIYRDAAILEKAEAAVKRTRIEMNAQKTPVL